LLIKFPFQTWNTDDDIEVFCNDITGKVVEIERLSFQSGLKVYLLRDFLVNNVGPDPRKSVKPGVNQAESGMMLGELVMHSVDSEVDSDARAEENPAGGQFTNSWALSIR
jgi:hypothetical protein